MGQMLYRCSRQRIARESLVNTCQYDELTMSISILKATMPCTLCFKKATKWPLNSPVSILVSHFGDKSVRYIIYFVVLRIESVRTILALQLL